MIFIVRPNAIPTTLQTRGSAAREMLQQEYLLHQSEYDSGTRSFDIIDSSIYGADDVKSALQAMQHGKCAFCEAKVTHISYGDVEHFRPKRGWRQDSDDTLHRPGYYWLAYEWSNLLFACQLCNQRHKRNLFPLVNSAARAVDHRSPVEAEEPLFIEPTREDPGNHITFNGHDLIPISGSMQGRRTIDALGLNRRELRDHRFDQLQKLKSCKLVLDLAARIPNLPAEEFAEVEEARALIQKAIRPEAEYSAMARALLGLPAETSSPPSPAEPGAAPAGQGAVAP